jgi:hypothetical protein
MPKYILGKIKKNLIIHKISNDVKYRSILVSNESIICGRAQTLI